MERRNRIVIDLDAGHPAPVRSGMTTRVRIRRWPKVLAIAVVLCILVVGALAVGGYVWWRSYQTAPAYSVALIIDAAQRNDMEALESRLDDEAIARNLVSSVRERASNRYGISLTGSLQSRIDSLLPTLLPRMKETIHSEVAKEVKDFSARTESKPFIVVAVSIRSLVTITTEGDNARVVAPLPDRIIELTMRRDGDRWKVTDFKDDVLVQRVADALMKDLPAIGGSDLKIPAVAITRRRQAR